MDWMQARDLMTADPATLPGTMTAGDALRYFDDEARHRSYPVVDGEGRLLGLVSRSDALDWRCSDIAPDSRLAEPASAAAPPRRPTHTPRGRAAAIIPSPGPRRPHGP